MSMTQDPPIHAEERHEGKEAVEAADANSTAAVESTQAATTARAHARQPLLTRKRILLILVLAGVAAGAWAGISSLVANFAKPDQALVFYEAQRGDLAITVTERGNLQSQQKVTITCDVESMGDRISGDGTRILFIVPNGASVKTGDLLVELDSAPLRERLDSQFLAVQRAENDQTQANVTYENQKSQNDTALAQAAREVQLAELELQAFEDEDGGTFQIDLEDVELAIQEAQASRLIKQADLKGVEMLYDLGYKSQGDVDAARLAYLGADRSLAKSLSQKRKKVEYDYQVQKLQLQGKVDTAKSNYEQVERNNVASLTQAKSAKDSADRTLKKEQERYAHYEKQLEKCKIVAPGDGMVTYSTGTSRYSRTVIAEGEYVRQRQQILELPNLTRMQVKTSIHESALGRVKKGMSATVRIESDDRTYPGTVKSVAVVPDQGGYLSSGVNVYSTIVTIDEDVEGLKPGMTAVVDIHSEVRKDVLSVPVQAIVQVGSESWVYVGDGGDVVRREVTLGRTNDKHVEVTSGIEEGDRVVLNPMAIVDESELQPNEQQDEEGSASDTQGDPTADSEAR